MLIFALSLCFSCPGAIAEPLEQQKTAAEREVQALQEKLEDAVEKYNYACYRLEQTQAQIADTEAELVTVRADLEKKKGRLNKRARALYMTSGSTFLNVIVNAEDVDELIVGMDMAKKIGQRDAELVQGVKAAKSQLESKKELLEKTKAEQAAAKSEMASAKNAVESQLSSAKGKLAGVEGQIREAMAQRAAEAARANAAARSQTSGRKAVDPVTSRKTPPGKPHGGVVGVAYAQLGKPYVYGAAGPNSFDCSGLVQYCYRVGVGISLPHSAYAQSHCGSRVSVSELQPGDIVGFRGWGHVGIYVGGGKYIHAPHSGDVVKVASLSSRGDFAGAVRP